jgi:PAS domain S-box-containing protein
MVDKHIENSEIRFRKLFNSSPYGMFVCQMENDALILIDSNPTVDKILGIKSKELIGKKIEDAFPGVAGTDIIQNYRKVAEEGIPWNSQEVYYDDGNKITGTFEVYAFQISDGIMVVSFVDSTQRIQDKLALEEERIQSLSIFDSIDEVIYISDPNTYEILWINKYFRNILGKDVIGGTCYKDFQGFTKVCDFCTNKEIIELDGKPYRWMFHNSILNRTYSITDRIIKWSDGRKVRFEIAIDITELKHAQEKLVRNERLATLGQISGGIGHELRNPLGAIKNAAYLLNMSLENPDKEIAETIEIINREVENCSMIVESLLEFARPRTPILQKVSIHELVADIKSSIKIPENVTIKEKYVKDAPILLGDGFQIKQVLRNLIENGVQAMISGGELEIETSLKSESDDFLIAIRDTGIGIPKENLDKIFEPLFTTKAKGIGLGLAIVNTIISAHQGSIDVKSTPEKGTEFLITLPLVRKVE